MVRYIVSLISGIAAGGLAVGLIQTIALNMYPMDPSLTEQQIQEALASMPNGYYWFNISSHILGAFGAGIVTAVINKKHQLKLGMIAAIVILVLTFLMNYKASFPDWVGATDVSLTILSGAIGAFIGSRKNR
ncbi:MAG: hypothetical protein HKN68_23080 [Saprospiraceae bacterium]|nr:hypothetical protein [Saprospiraceae bacterium]